MTRSSWTALGATRLPQWLAGISCLILSLPLIGWLLGIPVLRGFGDPHYAVAPLSAILGCSVTLATLLLVSGFARAARIVLLPAGILLGLTLIQYLTGAIAVERLFFYDTVLRLGVRNQGILPGGVAAMQALGACAALAGTSERRNHQIIGVILASAAVALTLLATAAQFAEQGGTSPAFLGRSGISTLVAMLPAAAMILYAMRPRPGERTWSLLSQLAPAIIILPAIPSLLGFAAIQADLLGFSAAQFLVLTLDVVILAWVLARAVRHAEAQSRALAIREAKLSAVLAMVPDAVVLMDESGTILDFSAAAEKLWGYPAEDMLGKSITMLAPAAHLARYEDEIAGLRGRELRPADAEPLSAIGQRRDGSVFPVEVRAGRVETGDDPCLTVFFRDMSAQFGIDDQVAQLNAELAHLARQSAMGEAAADLAHELNQPLTAAANYLSAATMVAKASGVEGPGIELVGNAREQVMQAGEIIRRLRSFTERNDTERSVEPMRPLIEDAVRLVLVGSGRLAAQIEYRVEPADLRAFVDRIQVQQVLVNLLRNALEALRTSGRTDPHIWITARTADDQMIEIQCRDNGPGLPEATLNHLFQRFSANTTSEGMGIGLSISKRIVELHGGVFAAANDPAGGAVFTFTLPTLDAPAN
jgi:PAS domain S-box-containing protein